MAIKWLWTTIYLPVLILFALSTPASAQERPVEDIDLALSWGTFGVLDTEQVFEVGAEVRFPALWSHVRPIVGTSILDDGGNYSYAGARYEYPIGGHWTASPSFALGVYSPGGVDLGGPLEFRSGIDFGYRLTSDLSLGLGLYHLSNGGLYSRNGGSESLLFSLVFDL